MSSDVISERLISSDLLNVEEKVSDNKIRPQSFQDYIGQHKVVEKLQVFIAAALKRGESLDHVLLFGPPGLGKTTLAVIIAHEMQATIKTTSGPVLEKPGELAALLTNLQNNDVLFIDEIHRLNPSIEEILYSAMEDGTLDIIIGEGAGARSIKIDLPKFTLVGATTRAGLLSAPLRDRFGIVERLQFYTSQDLIKIVERSANILGVSIEQEGAQQIATRSRGTPRIANRLLRRVRDIAEVKNNNIIDYALADYALNLLEIDSSGLDQQDKLLLQTLMEKFDGGPVGVASLAAAIGEERGTIEEVIEPYLIQQALIARTARGRVITEFGKKVLAEIARTQP